MPTMPRTPTPRAARMVSRLHLPPEGVPALATQAPPEGTHLAVLTLKRFYHPILWIAPTALLLPMSSAVLPRPAHP